MHPRAGIQVPVARQICQSSSQDDMAARVRPAGHKVFQLSAMAGLCDSSRQRSLISVGLDHDAQKMSQTTPDEKYHLITRRLQEVLGGDAIKALLVQDKTPKCYWGMYPNSQFV